MIAEASALGIFLPFLILVPLGFFGLCLLVFWVWMLIDCATKESSQGNDKLIWILVIVFTHWIGALIYFLVRRPQRKRELGV